MLLQVFGMELHMSYYSAIAPPLIYSIICSVTDMKSQVRIAQLLSIFYACVMGSYLIWNLFIAVEYNKLSALGLLMFCKSLSRNPFQFSRKKFSWKLTHHRMYIIEFLTFQMMQNHRTILSSKTYKYPGRTGSVSSVFALRALKLSG